MKKTLLVVFAQSAILGAIAQDTTSIPFNDTLMLQNIEVTSVRASEKAPFTKTNLTKEQIQERNNGKDLPFILNQMPSVVASSDAGNGVGYTNLKIRGSDETRINVTLNGIPFNDAESQGSFFVNLPDIASSLTSVQVQRGAGTSSNGPGAFGATINLSTNEVNREKYLELNNNYGSFNTWKNTLKVGTGLLGNHFTVDARLSHISSDGYIDRASTNLRSFFGSAAYLNKKTSLRFNVIAGREKTYQAWNGVHESVLKTERTSNSAGSEKPGMFYDNETDNYKQTHYQMFLNQQVTPSITFNAGLFLVRGKGYFENYKARQKFSKYGLPNYVSGTDIIERTDLILQRWLDNYFYGTVLSAQYAKGKTHLTVGGGYSQYDGDHFNRIIWAEVGVPENYSSYLLPAHKNDLNVYSKWMQSLGNGFNSFIDLQFRDVNYEINGFKDNPDLYIHKHYSFFNPKVGMSWMKQNLNAFASFSMATKEPNRKDFEADVYQLPRPEKLYDWEAGFGYSSNRFTTELNLYYMFYKDQLVNTGKKNDVGAFTRTNAPESYRAGIELQAGYKAADWMQMNANVALSRNKIRKFVEYIYDENPGSPAVENHFEDTDISFSPNVVAGGTIQFMPFKGADISLISKFVGDQFLDNTSDKNRMLSSYFTEDIKFSYGFSTRTIKEIGLMFQINNVFNKLYEASGHTYNYIEAGTLHVENYYFPMAGINFVAGLNLKF